MLQLAWLVWVIIGSFNNIGGCLLCYQELPALMVKPLKALSYRNCYISRPDPDVRLEKDI